MQGINLTHHSRYSSIVEHLMESKGLDSTTNLRGKNKIHNTNLNRAKLRRLLGLNVRCALRITGL